MEKFKHRVLLELNRDPEITVAQFLGTFKGLSSTQRRATVAAAAGLSGAKLSALLDGRSIDTGRAGRLLGKMQGASKPPKSSVLGGVGKICIAELASSDGVRSCDADFTYLVVEGGEQTPWRWEIGFAELESASARVLYLGHNFSPLVTEDVFLRSLTLPHQLQGSDAPVFLFLHRIAADPDSLDFGKSHIVVRNDERTALTKAIFKVAKRYLDRSGQLRSNLAELSGAVCRSPERLTIDRFGLNHDFIEEQGLTWIDNLRTAKKKPPNDLADPKHPDHQKDYVQDYLRQFGPRKCEANALVTRQAAARQLCLDAITRYLPKDAPKAYQAKLAPLREQLRLAIADRLLGRGETGR